MLLAPPHLADSVSPQVSPRVSPPASSLRPDLRAARRDRPSNDTASGIERWGSLALVTLVHLAVGAALLAWTPLRQLLPAAPLMVRFITPEIPVLPEPPKPEVKPEPVPEVKIVKKVQQPKPQPMPLLAVASDAPSPVTIAPRPEPPRQAAPIDAAPAAASPPAPPSPPQPKQVSEVEYLRAPQPVYPPISRRTGEAGRVVLRVLINAQGQPEEAQIRTSSGFQRLDEAARRAAMGAAFRPYREGGQAIPVWAVIPISFSLEG